MAQLTAEMKEIVDFLIARDVLLGVHHPNTEYSRFPGQKFRKTIYVGCPDCDEFKDKMVFHGTKIGEKFHPIAPVHGGGSALHPASLMMPQDAPRIPYEYFVYEIVRGARIKKTRKVSFYSHAPCSAAADANFSIPQLIEMQLYNRGLLEIRLQKNEFSMEVYPYFHVDFQTTRGAAKDKRTFLVSREAWIEVREEFWREHLAHVPHHLTELAAA